MNLIIRKLKAEDIQQGLLDSLANLFPVQLSDAQAQEIYHNLKNNPVYRLFVAELNGLIVGATTLLVEQKFILRGAKFGYIEDMAVRKGYERQGIGTRLLQEAIKEAKNEGCRLVRLDCSDETRSFYEKQGFVNKENVHRMQLKLTEDLF